MITMEPYEKTFRPQWSDVEIEMVPQLEWNLHTTLNSGEIKYIIALARRRCGHWEYDRQHATPPS